MPEVGKRMHGERKNAIITASHARDFERCRLLCETIDRQVSGYTCHYILVAGHDVALFRRLQSKRRQIVDERDLLPAWMHPVRDPTSLFARHVWLSYRTAPLRGWHVQQLRRIAIAGHLDEDALFSCDSDVVFVKPFDCGSLWRDDRLRFLRRRDALARPELEEQRLWSRNAAAVLGIGDEPASLADYIGTAIAWRRDSTMAMKQRIEANNGCHFVEAVASTRAFSECMLYGRFVDGVMNGEGHFATEQELCRTYWEGPRLSGAELARFVSGMAPWQVAIGLQSFVGTDIHDIRRLVEAA